MRKRTRMNRDGDAVPLVMQSFHNLDEDDAEDELGNYETRELRGGNRSIWRKYAAASCLVKFYLCISNLQPPLFYPLFFSCNRRHFLVIGAMLASLVFIAVGVTVALSRPSNAESTGAVAPCVTPDCVRTAAEVRIIWSTSCVWLLMTELEYVISFARY